MIKQIIQDELKKHTSQDSQRHRSLHCFGYLSGFYNCVSHYHGLFFEAININLFKIYFMKPLTRKQRKRLMIMLWTYPILVAILALLSFLLWMFMHCIVVYPN